jgi:hypothetical protein
MLKKLGTDAISASRQNSITANDIASRLLRVSKTQRDRVHVRTIKMNLRRKKRTLTVNQTLSRNFTLDELETALMSLKPGKAARFDGIYPEFMKNFGAQTKEWIISFMNDIVSTSKIPNLFERAKVIAIIKPGKDGSDPAHYRLISLLGVVYKLLDCLILQRIQPLIEDVTPINQAGFRQHHSCIEQVMALKTHIEAGFRHQLKTGAVFVDLTAAYDTVWREGLMIQFLEALCLKLFNLLSNMLSNRYFQVFVGDQSSRTTDYLNLYMSDLPPTASKVFQYADDIAVTYQAKTFDECENNLEADIEVLNQFFHRWCLQPNPGNTEMCVFHLNTHAANKQLDVQRHFNKTCPSS